MATKIRITIGSVGLDGELLNSACAQAIARMLPLGTKPNEWGDEFYFTIPLKMPLDDTATVQVKVGDIGYWPPGNALAIFFGPTPISRGSEPVPASEVNLVGKIMGDATMLRRAKGSSTIRIVKAESGML